MAYILVDLDAMVGKPANGGVTPQLHKWSREIVIFLRNIGEDHEILGERHGGRED